MITSRHAFSLRRRLAFSMPKITLPFSLFFTPLRRFADFRLLVFFSHFIEPAFRFHAADFAR